MTKPSDHLDDPRRRLLIGALSLAAMAVPGGLAQGGPLLGRRPGPLPAGQSIFSQSGAVLVNGKPAGDSSRIAVGDTVVVSDGGELVFIVNSNAMILRGGSELVIQPRAGMAADEAPAIGGLLLKQGKLLSVSRFTPMRVQTAAANIAIGGNGFYLESDAERTYFCTCYGTADVRAAIDAQARETVVSEHHDKPLYILPKAGDGRPIRNAPFVDHTDMELALIEAVAGRATPFTFPDDYAAPRRRY
jgi:hypothetical protein